MARLLPKKTKWELVIRDKNFLDLNTWLSLVDTRFVLLFLEFTKKDISECLRATQWKFDYSPSEKQLLKYWLLDGFTIVSFCFWKDTSAASAIFALAFAFAVGVSGLALNKVTKWEFITVVKKYPLCILALCFLNLWTFPLICRNCPSTKLA